MTAAVIGYDTRIGECFVRELSSRGHEVFTEADIDISENEKFWHSLRHTAPDAVIYCRSFQDTGTEIISRVSAICERQKIPVMFISSSQVFGKNGVSEEKSLRMPSSDFGLNLYKSENIIKDISHRFYIIRIPEIIFGQGGEFDIISRLMERGKEQKSFSFDSVTNFSVINMRDAAAAAVDIIEKGRYGVYHCANRGKCNMFAFACETYRLLRLAGYDCYTDINISASEKSQNRGVLLRCVNMGRNSIRLPDSWQESLARCLTENISIYNGCVKENE